MYGAKQLLLSLLVMSVSATETAKKTMVGLETEKSSYGKDVELDDCVELDEDEVFTISIRKHCRVFTGPLCTGRNTLLSPGDHSNDDPVPITSIYCHAKTPF
ncbi:hypothetical protein N7462_006730 [Penicillium macrosclerotiorum]|uniref:uncharacterized protein n=1 Tax=Penicillium macrosclerotiorum TaxID=303699 RepID=UPI0025493ADF|nr:uncharacterized protein N7462_006730 [Penicillium macrosclerotiorum]KAJ5683565.1 hypothetical protein N7462_006730 [Penicillium macrosclerotiorum]